MTDSIAKNRPGRPSGEAPGSTDLAFKMFGIVHGNGDGGSEASWHAMNPCRQNGWIKLAKKFSKQNCEHVIAAARELSTALAIVDANPSMASKDDHHALTIAACGLHDALMRFDLSNTVVKQTSTPTKNP